MARRRRGRFNRIRPDMGWWVDQGSMSFTYNPSVGEGEQSFGTAESIVQFNDITDDDSLILRDNSDWFIKRVIFEAWPRYTSYKENVGYSDTIRLYTCSIGTIDNDKLAEWVVNQPHTLFEPGGYEMWARMLRTYNKPVYYDWKPKRVQYQGTDGQLLVQSSALNTAYTQNMAVYGPSHIADDFSVSNAGLKPEQSLSIGCSVINPSGFSYDWEDGDAFDLGWALRVLLQKRRAA